MKQVIYKERKYTDCEKWDGLKNHYGAEDLLPLWVADMDFQVPKCVSEGLKEYVEQGTFGYYLPPAGYIQSFIDWEKKYHHYDVKPEWIRFAPGVVPALYWFVQILTKETDKVMIQTPVYGPFSGAVEGTGRTLVKVELINDQGNYTMDFERMEQEIKQQQVKLFILCSPHNPVGRVWTKEELVRLLEMCKKYGVKVLADEIHHDLIMKGHKQFTAAALGDYDDMLVTLTAASKTFNLAASANSFVVIPNKGIREQFDRFANRIRLTGGNGFGYIAVQKAYEGGRAWLEELLDIIQENYECAKTILKDAFPQIEISPLEGTYLMWVNLGSCIKGQDVKTIVQERARLAVNYGEWFGGNEFQSFIRINLATSRENVETAVKRLADEIRKYTAG